MEFQGISSGTYRSTVNVVNNDPNKGNVEMTNLPPVLPEDDEIKQPILPSIPKSESTHEILNLTLHQVWLYFFPYWKLNEPQSALKIDTLTFIKLHNHNRLAQIQTTFRQKS